MKFVALFGAVLLLGLVQADFDENMQAFGKECITETGVDPTHLVELKRHEFTNNDPKVKCFVKCFCTKSGVCDKQWNINVEKMEEHVPEDKRHKLDDAIGACALHKKSDDCDSIYDHFKCIYEHLEK